MNKRPKGSADKTSIGAIEIPTATYDEVIRTAQHLRLLLQPFVDTEDAERRDELVKFDSRHGGVLLGLGSLLTTFTVGDRISREYAIAWKRGAVPVLNDAIAVLAAVSSGGEKPRADVVPSPRTRSSHRNANARPW